MYIHELISVLFVCTMDGVRSETTRAGWPSQAIEEIE